MNRDEIAALVALQRSLGWKILVREFQIRHEALVRLMLNRDTPLEEVRQGREFMAGVQDVLAWPARQIEMFQPAEEPMRPAVMVMQTPEEGNG
jgi:hypothetical protein